MAAGKTVTVRVSGGTPDYTSLNAALVGEAADFSSATTGSETVGGKTWDDIALFIELDPAGGDDSTVANISQGGWVIDSTHRLLIATKDSEWPSTSAEFAPGSSGFYTIAISNPSFFCFKNSFGVIGEGGLVVSGMEIRQTSAAATNKDCIQEQHATGGDVSTRHIYDSIICENVATDSASNAVAVDGRHSAWMNCYFECAGGNGINYSSSAAYRTDTYNCLATGCGGDGFVINTTTDGTSNFLNNVGYNNTGDDFTNITDSFNAATNNWSEDGTQPGTGGGSTITSADFVNAGTDWTPASGSDLEDGGADLTPTYIANDEDGVGYTRTGTWDAGPVERQPAAGGANIEVIGNYYRNLLAGS